MKKQISLVAVIVMMVVSSTLFAQSNKNVISTLAKSIRSHKSIEVSFTYRASDMEEAKEGKAYFQDGSYKVIFDDQQTISDGKTLWHYLVEDEEVMVGNASDDDNPFKILDQLERDSSGITPTLDSKGNLKSVEIEVEEGSKITLNIVEMKFDQDYPEAFFTFDEKAYPNVEVIDMR
jgi:outer membrane lipoprotein-sorting protein